MQARVGSFFMRPDAPRVRCLRIDVVFGFFGLDYRDFDDGEDGKDWQNALNEIGRHPPSLGWLAPVLRSARSLRQEFAS